jgi:hypothetical protein
VRAETTIPPKSRPFGMKLLFVFFFLLLGVVGHAQMQSETNVHRNRLSVFIDPLPLLDTYSGSSYRGGFEMKAVKRFAVCLEGGGYFRNFNGLHDVRGYVFKAEVKHYLSPELENMGLYLSAEYFYKRQGYSFSDTIDATPDYPRAYRMEKYITACNLKIGVMTVERWNIVLDAYAGLGIRVKHTSSDLTAYEREHRKFYNDSQSDPLVNGVGNFIYPNLVAGFKIGYCIR